MHEKFTGTAMALSMIAVGSQGAMAQDSAATIAALEQRVATLEQQNRVAPSGNRLSFSVANGTEITLYGFARFEAFYDFDFAQGDLSRTSRIGEAAFATDGEFETSVRVSRFGIRSKTATDVGEIGTQLEFDLFSGDDTTTSPQLRLRHANVTIDDRWLFGQFWTNLQPLQHYPRTADFNGPVGIVFARVPQVRYTYNNGNGFQFSGSIEEAAGGSSDPVLTAAAAYDGDRFSVRAAGLVGTFEDAAGFSRDTNAITLSGSVTPWQGGRFSATYVTGEAIGNLLIGGGDRVVGGVTNDAYGYTLEYRHDITNDLNVGVAYGRESYDLATNTGTIDFTDLETVHVNAFWTPTERLTVAAEYIRGERTSAAGVTSSADRIGASITFGF